MPQKDQDRFVYLLKMINEIETRELENGISDEDPYFLQTQKSNDEIMKLFDEAEEIRLRLATVGINCYKYYREVVENE